MNFFDFSSNWEFFASTNPILWVLGVGIVISLRLGIPFLTEKWQPLDLWLHIFEWMFVVFFLILAIPGLVNASIQAGSNSTMIPVAGLILMLVLFARWLVHSAQEKEKRKVSPSEQTSSKHGEPVPVWVTLAVIAGISTLVILRRSKTS